MLLETIQNKLKNKTPIWFMRQAGRHLKDYRRLRRTHTDFITFCLDEESIVKATLMPVEKYDLDAAILFSDILTIPWALNQRITFIKNSGPILIPITEDLSILKTMFDIKKFNPVANAIKKIVNTLDGNKILIGFAGAPWTLACYMIEGKSTKSFHITRKFLWEEKKTFFHLIEKLINCIVDLLEMQANSGAKVLMIFDSWSHMIPFEYWDTLAIKSISQIVKKLRSRKIFCPIIGFPFKAGEKLVKYSYESGVDVVSVDWNTDLNWVAKNINKNSVIQGNLDPILLTTSSQINLYNSVKEIMNIMSEKVHIFNVGHGLTPETKPSNIHKVINYIRKNKDV